MVAIAPRFNLTLLARALAGAVALSLAMSRAVSVSAPAVQVSEARLAPGTEGLLQQTAAHLSKMQRGASIGGFPGFEPPDDEKYRRKIKEQNYSAQDLNGWVKEINNFLGQIVKKNPGLSLEEMLQRQGLSPSQIDSFTRALRDTHFTATSLKGFGVEIKTVETLESLMSQLGVSAWTY